MWLTILRGLDCKAKGFCLVENKRAPATQLGMYFVCPCNMEILPQRLWFRLLQGWTWAKPNGSSRQASATAWWGVGDASPCSIPLFKTLCPRQRPPASSLEAFGGPAYLYSCFSLRSAVGIIQSWPVRPQTLPMVTLKQALSSQRSLSFLLSGAVLGPPSAAPGFCQSVLKLYDFDVK